jgi:Zn-dependent protease with chaperone function
VDTVYLTPGTDLGVAESGPLRARLADRGHRFLVLGIGGLGGLSQAGLRAILAHEYGHFSNRDTAGGGIATAVLGALGRTVMALASRGGLLILNPAWHFLRGFCALFMRITLGASRLQEVMADHFAALAYGPKAFSAGLTHVIRRSVEFDHETNQLIGLVEKARAPIASLYHRAEGATGTPEERDAAVAAALSAKGSPYDSHPPPAQRMEWVSRLPDVGADADPESDAWALFDGPAGRVELEVEMTGVINDRLEKAGLIAPTPLPPFAT